MAKSRFHNPENKSQKIRDLLKVFPDIKPKKAAEKLEYVYNKNFCNTFYRVKNKPLKQLIKPPSLPLKKKTKGKTNVSNNTQNSANFDTSNIIDDPNELLMSCAMRELNKATPDVRWGNILLTLLDKTKRLESKSNKEVMIRRKLVKYSSNQLIELRKKLIKS